MNSVSTDSALVWPRKQVADLLVLVGCGAVGLALARWLDPYGYTNGYRATPGWVFAHAVLPAWFGVVNLGQVSLLALHWSQRRRHPDLTPIEFCGVVSTAARCALFAVPMLANHSSRGGGMGVLLVVLAAGLTTLISTISCTASLVGRTTRGERLHWPEYFGLGAAVPTGLWLPYELITSLPVC